MTAQPMSLFAYQILIHSVFPLVFGPLLLLFCSGTKQNRSKPTQSQYTLSAQSNSIPETASELKDNPQSTQISELAKTDSRENPQATQPDTKNTNATSPKSQENKESQKDVPNQAQKTAIAQKEETEAKHSPGESLGEYGSAFSETSKHYRQDPTQISENKKKTQNAAKTPKHANLIKSSSSNQKQIEKEHSKQRDLTQYSEIKKKSQNSAIKQAKSTDNTSSNQKLIAKEPAKQARQKEKSEMAENKMEKTQISAAKSIVSEKKIENKTKHSPPAKTLSKAASTK